MSRTVWSSRVAVKGLGRNSCTPRRRASMIFSAELKPVINTTDTFGNVILEAQASGLPCVVSDQGGPRELVAHGEDGFVTRGGDLAELCEAARHLCTDQKLRCQLGVAARRKVEDRSWPNAARRFWEISA